MTETEPAVKYAKVAEVTYDDYSPDGDCSYGYVTVKLPEDVFGTAVRKYLYDFSDGLLGFNLDVLLTTERCWSGYSEYTVTNEWQEVTVTVPSRGWWKTWDSVGKFLVDVATANPEGPHR